MAAIPAQTGTGAATERRASDRGALLTLGRAGGGWEFLTRAWRVVEAAPGDHETRRALVVSLARLGLRTLALEHVDRLEEKGCEGGEAGSSARALRQLAEGLPEDRVSRGERESLARSGIEGLAARGVMIGAGEVERWREETGGEEWFRASDGNVVRRARGGVMTIADAVGAAGRFQAPASAGAANRRPWYLDGLASPWMLLRLLDLAPRQNDGFAAPIRVVEESPSRLLDALALCDLTDALGRERVRMYAGAGALGILEREVGADLGLTINGFIVPSSGPAGESAARLERTIRGLCDRQGAELARATASAHAIYKGRDRAWWGRRYREALSGVGEPLGVLIPSCRYSTYVRHASEDIAAAFGAMGCRARVLIEPDDSATFSNGAHARAIEEMRPDLVVLINYTRESLGAAIPRNVPFVCWIQDTMGHLFQEGAGASQGEFDFLVGHLHAELFTRCGFPRGRSLASPVLALGAKFHGGAIEGSATRGRACEMAYAGHQSETAEECRDRLLREARAAGPRNAMPALIEALYPACVLAAEESWTAAVGERLRIEAERALASVMGREPDAGLTARIVNEICAPIADRAIRHGTLEWAASIARRRGWRLHLYGRGWERHPTLGEFAKGSAGHGEELRACYRSARVHLHASINGMAHQRIMECALSGGLPLMRLKRDDILMLDWYTQASVAAAGAKLHRIEGIPFTEVAWVHTADHWKALVLESQRQRLGLPLLIPGRLYIGERLAADPWGARMGEPMEHEVAWLLGDLSETTFFDEGSLERLARRAVEEEGWRENLSGGIARRVRSHLTYERMAGRILDMVGASFESEDSCAGESGRLTSGRYSEPGRRAG